MLFALFVLSRVERCCWRTARRLRKFALRVQRMRVIIIRNMKREYDGWSVKDGESESTS